MQEASRFHKEIGNTTQNMDVTVEFQTKDKDKAKKLGNIPFQVQITYRRPDQMKCLRVISKCRQFTQNRKDIEKVNYSKLYIRQYAYLNILIGLQHWDKWVGCCAKECSTGSERSTRRSS